MTLGEKLQKGRKEAGLSQEELAEQLGVSRQAVSRWENDNGYPEMEKMIRLSQIYRVSLDYLAGNAQGQSTEAMAGNGEKQSTEAMAGNGEGQFTEAMAQNGWYVSAELAQNFLAYQKSKYAKAGICFLLAGISSVFSYMGIYSKAAYAASTLVGIAAVILGISIVVSDNPYKKIWTELLNFDEKVLKQLRVEFAENKKRYKGMLLGGAFVLLAGLLFWPELYYIFPEDLRHIWYAAGDAVWGIGGYFAVYAWGVRRAYRVLTVNEEYRRKKKK